MDNSPPRNLSNILFDPFLLRQQPQIPEAFIWPKCHRPHNSQNQLEAPVIDLAEFLSGYDDASACAAVRDACASLGLFQVINHQVDPGVCRAAMAASREFFDLPLGVKLHARRQLGSRCGYVGAHSDRFNSSLPWKETLTFDYDFGENGRQSVVKYFTSNFGEDFQSMGRVYETYCEAMKKLSLSIMELLDISLGTTRHYYREFFQDGNSTLRCNNYPPCPEPELTLGTGHHTDPTSLTVLEQDQVDGMQVFAGGKWCSVSPVSGALIVNIGDTFMALTNGVFKSCIHRSVVNRDLERRSLAFFVSPRGDKVVRPPVELINGEEEKRAFPDFTWAELLEFTQTEYRSDSSTLKNFFARTPKVGQLLRYRPQHIIKLPDV